MSEDDRLEVHGVGAAAPAGLDALTLAMALRADKIEPRPSPFRDRLGAPIATLRCRSLRDDLHGMDRLVELGGPPLREAALRASGAPVPLLLATGEADRPRSAALDAGELLVRLGERCGVPIDRARSRVFPGGSAAFAAALEAASVLARSCPLVAVGGLDSHYDPITLLELARERRLQTLADEGGVVPAEGAAFVLVGRARGGLATIGGARFARCHEEDSAPAMLARSLAGTMRALDGRRPGWILSDTNHERRRQRGWSVVERRLAERWEAGFRHEPVAVVTGDAGAATGALALAYALMQWSAGSAPSRAALFAVLSDDDACGSWTALAAESAIVADAGPSREQIAAFLERAESRLTEASIEARPASFALAGARAAVTASSAADPRAVEALERAWRELSALGGGRRDARRIGRLLQWLALQDGARRGARSAAAHRASTTTLAAHQLARAARTCDPAPRAVPAGSACPRAGSHPHALDPQVFDVEAALRRLEDALPPPARTVSTRDEEGLTSADRGPTEEAAPDVRQMEAIARDALEDIAGLAGARTRRDEEAWTTAEPFERRLRDNIDLVMAVARWRSGEVDVVSLAERYAARWPVADPGATFCRTIVMGCVEGDDCAALVLEEIDQGPPRIVSARAAALSLAPSSSFGPMLRARLWSDSAAKLMLEALASRRELRIADVAPGLEHSDLAIAAAAVRGLAVVRERPLARQLVQEMLARSDAGVCLHLAVVESAVRLGVAAALDVLRATIDRAAALDPDERAALVRLLAVFGDASDAARLLRAARTPDALEALGWHGSAALVPALIERLSWLENAPPSVAGSAAASACREALCRIVGAGPFDRARDWRSVWDDNERRFEPFRKHRNGVKYRISDALAEMIDECTPVRARRMLHLELSAAIDVVPPCLDDWVTAQRAGWIRIAAEMPRACDEVAGVFRGERFTRERDASPVAGAARA